MDRRDIETGGQLPVRLPEGIQSGKDQQHQQKTQNGLRPL
jgi:hypothetical protein